MINSHTYKHDPGDLRQSLVRKLLSHRKSVLCLIFGLSFGLHVFHLDFYSLWYDEVTGAGLVQDRPVGETFDTILGISGSETLHPIYYLILSAWTQIAGNSDLALRFPSVVFGSCAAVVYAVLLYQIGGMKAFSFSLLIIVSPFLMWYSRDARPYALLMFLSGLHLLFYLKLLIRPISKIALVGFIVTGVLMIYSGILTGMLLIGELIWSLFFRRNIKEAIAITLVLLLTVPLVWHGLQTHFLKSSDRYSELPGGMNVVRAIGILQEFFVARSLGPTPSEVRRLPLIEAVYNKSTELCVELVAIILISAAFLLSFRSLDKRERLREMYGSNGRAVGCVTAACIVQAMLLVLFTGYRLNGRHLAFLFGPLFALLILPIAYSNKQALKVLFVAPLLVLWGWSSSNQVFDASYQQEDFRNAAYTINNDPHGNTHVVALCHPNALQYYGIDRPLVYFRESPDITCRTLLTYLKDRPNPTWVVLGRPWNYPGFCPEELVHYFQVLSENHLPGVDMWLLTLRSSK